MLKEYYVVARYVAQIPESVSFEDTIHQEVINDFRGLSPNQLDNFIKTTFSVIEGEEVEIEEDGQND